MKLILMRRLNIIAVLVIILSTQNVFIREVASSETSSNGRLPKDLMPLHYLVRIQPFINGNFSIYGFVEITFRVDKPTDKIILNIKDIITSNDTVKVRQQSGNKEFQVTNQVYEDDKQFYTATLDSNLQPGMNYILSMEYKGYINDQLKGLYRSSYQDDNGNERFLATTQFQATDARRAFPCFDEPAFKANFKIEIIREEKMMSVSNMPLESSIPHQNQPGWFVDKFEESVKMSTYLVALIVSDFEIVKSNQTSYEFAMVTRSNVVSRIDYALDIGPKIMKFFEKFFNVKYPLPKLYMAAVPDFSFGGMENWGLVIYRESGLLYDESHADAFAKRRTSLLVSHELAHQWFGNLVTPAWWNDLWLNEGFASYVEYLGMNAVDPTQKFLDQVVVLDLQDAFSKDCIETSHPISQPVDHPNQISEIFDAISYKKGASIIRMMSHFLTEDTFRKALTNYLTELSFKNSEQDDLWNYMTESAHQDSTLDASLSVKEIMDTWTLQMGYPVLSVLKNSDGNLLLKQERFLMYINYSSTDTHDYKWWIPITYTTSSDANFNQTKPKEWMTPSETEKTLQGESSEDDWMIFNLQSAGYFRVNYDEENWRALANQLKNKNQVIHSVNRAQILDDALNLARAGMISYDIALDILSYLSKEQEYVPLTAAITAMGYLKKMLPSSTPLKKFFLSLMDPQYEQVGFEDHPDDHQLDQQRRIQILRWVCNLGHEYCVERSLQLFNEWMKSPDTQIIPLNLKETVYCTAIAQGGQVEWGFLWKRYTSSNIATEKDLILRSLACSKDESTLQRYLERSIDPQSGIRKQDARSVISAVAANEKGQVLAWNFIKENWDSITSYYGPTLFTLSIIVEAVTQNLNTQEQLEQLQAFRSAQKGNFLSAERTIEQAEENLKINLKWMDNSQQTIKQWLKDNDFGEDETPSIAPSVKMHPLLITLSVGIFLCIYVNLII